MRNPYSDSQESADAVKDSIIVKGISRSTRNDKKYLGLISNEKESSYPGLRLMIPEEK